MRTAVILLLFASAVFSQLQTACGSCGGPAPSACAELATRSVACEVPSASFVCEEERVHEGWLFCPSCEEGFAFSKCVSDWFFGLHKTTRCVRTYSTECGGYCSQTDNVISRTSCGIKMEKKCCDIPTNFIEIVSPAGNNLAYYRNDTVNFSITCGGKVDAVIMDYDDGTVEEVVPGNCTIRTSHTYTLPGNFVVRATALSCKSCPHQFNSTSTTSFFIQYR